MLSTFNGEKYLEPQLKSILNQSQVDIHLLIRDDGSTDRTPLILKSFESLENIEVTFGKNLGWRDSFMTLLQMAPFSVNSYYAFADQDDVWNSKKMITAVEKIDSQNPMLYHSNVLLTDGSGKIIGKKFKETFNPSRELPSSFFNGYGVGSTMVFNSKLLSLLKLHLPIKQLPHDAYVIALCNLLGTTIYDSSSYIYYRRHGDNATGFSNSSRIERPSLADRYRRYKSGPKNSFSKRAYELLEGYSDMLEKKDVRFLRMVAYYESNILYKLNLLLNPAIHATGVRKTLQVKFRVLVNTL